MQEEGVSASPGIFSWPMMAVFYGEYSCHGIEDSHHIMDRL